jgi:hypothetical protein
LLRRRVPDFVDGQWGAEALSQPLRILLPPALQQNVKVRPRDDGRNTINDVIDLRIGHHAVTL